MSDFFLTHSSLSLEEFKSLVLGDYAQIVRSREVSLLCRKDVLQGYASFGISGDGKELPQVVMSHYFQKGDFLSGYYRDQTFCFAKDIISIEQYFAQLFADVEANHDPCSSGRQMNSHFATNFLDENGNWLDLTKSYNIPANMSQTAGQFPRSIGFAFISKLFRNKSVKIDPTGISQKGNEVCFCTIGDGSTAEGHFFETVHTAAALQVPVAFFIWDDGYGISVPSKQFMAKGSIAEALSGMAKKNDTDKQAIEIYSIEGWNYAELHEKISEGIKKVRKTHTPAIFHVKELTQPLGHSSSGSHERYKSKERLKWEAEYDCNNKMREWILANKIATEEQLADIEKEAKDIASRGRKNAWDNYIKPIHIQTEQTTQLLRELDMSSLPADLQGFVTEVIGRWEKKSPLHRHEIVSVLRNLILLAENQGVDLPSVVRRKDELMQDGAEKYNSLLYSNTKSAQKVELVKPVYEDNAPVTNGYKVINEYFDKLLENNPLVFAFGEDVGEIGDVNQGFSNLQSKHGKYRVFDTSIRELTIVGQAIGMAMRGVKPIAEIQYVDYLLYGLQPLSDDVATLHYRTAGKQSCPLIIRTRGHRLEGIWHSGSPISMMANTLKGFMIGVPRSMVQAAAMYNSLIESNDPGIIVESLNGYRLKETLPSNVSKIKLPFGLCEVLKEGTDLTAVSYGSTLRIVQEAANYVEKVFNISVEVIDIQTILPFDTENIIVQSLQKTNRIIFVDEDVEGGFASTMMAEVIDKRGGFYHLDARPKVISAKPNRTSYGRDGEYFSKPSLEDIVEGMYHLARE